MAEWSNATVCKAVKSGVRIPPPTQIIPIAQWLRVLLLHGRGRSSILRRDTKLGYDGIGRRASDRNVYHGAEYRDVPRNKVMIIYGFKSRYPNYK